MRDFKQIIILTTSLSYCLFFFLPQSFAQKKTEVISPGGKAHIQINGGLDPKTSLRSRVGETPGAVIKRFRDAGMNPKEHQLTATELLIVDSAIAKLPPLHRRVLRDHLQSISFLDEMPNTALTSPVNKDERFKLYNITIRAAILKQTTSQWVTEKERTCFDAGSSGLNVFIQAGGMNALIYVLLHEATHVVDGSLELLPGVTAEGELQNKIKRTAFVNGTWSERTVLLPKFQDSVLNTIRFRQGGEVLPIEKAKLVYPALAKTPLVSLYSGSSWHEDLAEFLSVYHFTQQMGQPFRIVLKDDDKEVFLYEPMKSPLVKSRWKAIRQFYVKS
jgi:hypothetical protein